MSPLPPDPYKLLGVSPEAQIAEIRAAHRKLVLKCHPDKVQDPELKAQKQDEFQKVQQAYEILSNEKERQKYDEKVQLFELRQQMANKANISVSRSSPKYAEFEVRTAEPSSSYKSSSSHTMPNVKIYTTTTPSYSRSYEEDRRSGPRYYEAEPRPPRRETSYHEKSYKRSSEKEREKERDRDREKDKEKRRRKEREREQAEAERRMEKEQKKAFERQEKKAREKQRSKEMKRETGDKRRETDPYIEDLDEDLFTPKLEKKSSSSKKHDKRERSSHRDDPVMMPRYSEEPAPISIMRNFAEAYISKSRGEDGPERTHAYHLRSREQPPAAPTPPPAPASVFPPPKEEEIRRSSARPRPGSGDVPMLSRERSYQRPSKEHLDREPIIVSASPSSRHMPKSSAADMAGSPPYPISRMNSMPANSDARPIPGVSRANTYSYGEMGDLSANRGRGRNRHHSQVPEETESEEEYEVHRTRESRKHRSKKQRSPERPSETRYYVDNGRTTKMHSSSYTRKLNDAFDMYSESVRPSMPPRESSYTESGYRVRTSKPVGENDIQYSSYGTARYRDDRIPAGYA